MNRTKSNIMYSAVLSKNTNAANRLEFRANFSPNWFDIWLGV